MIKFSRLLLAVLAFAAFLLAGIKADAQSTPSPTPTSIGALIIPNHFSQGQQINAPPFEANFQSIQTWANQFASFDYSYTKPSTYYFGGAVQSTLAFWVGPYPGNRSGWINPNGTTIAGISDTGMLFGTEGAGYFSALDKTGDYGTLGSFNSVKCSTFGNNAAVGTAQYCSGTGAPAFSAPNGSIYLRYDAAAGSNVYVNTSGVSTSGATWTGTTFPTYNLAGAPVATFKVRVVGTVSAVRTTCGPFVNQFCATIVLPTTAPFSFVSLTATSFDCGGGSSLSPSAYWLHDFGQFSVEWNTPQTVYVLGAVASQPVAFPCEGN